MTTSDLHVIVGLGTTGFSCARFLKEQGVRLAVTDTRAAPPYLEQFQKSFPDVPVLLGMLNQQLLNDAQQIILSPGIALREPLIAEQVKRGKPVIGDVELFAQVAKAPVIGITGTNAKSTVTTLVGKMAEAAGLKIRVGGNLGVPVLDLLDDDQHTDVYVLELSSFQLETTHSLHAEVATVLNVTPDHMDRYRDISEYQLAKHRVYHECRVAVCNQDDPLTDYRAHTLAHKLNFTLKTPGQQSFGLLSQSGSTFLAFEDQALLNIDALPVAGKHYQANALAALAIGYGFGLSFEPMLEVLKTFTGLPHRCQFVRKRNGVNWYNDSKGTNVGATEAAIQGLGSEIKGKLILIAGGMGKNADFTPLLPLINRYTRHVVLIGEAAKELGNMIGDHKPISFAASMDEAVKAAASAALPDDSVLLSPACASFDMFKNFEHRGDVFMDLVKKL